MHITTLGKFGVGHRLRVLGAYRIEARGGNGGKGGNGRDYNSNRPGEAGGSGETPFEQVLYFTLDQTKIIKLLVGADGEDGCNGSIKLNSDSEGGGGGATGENTFVIIPSIGTLYAKGGNGGNGGRGIANNGLINPISLGGEGGKFIISNLNECEEKKYYNGNNSEAFSVNANAGGLGATTLKSTSSGFVKIYSLFGGGLAA